MKKHKFYQKFANTPIEKRFELLSNDYSSPLLGMTLFKVYEEIKEIDDKTRNDLSRQEELLKAIEPFLTPNS